MSSSQRLATLYHAVGASGQVQLNALVSAIAINGRQSDAQQLALREGVVASAGM
jgi:hypothetical protein